MTIYVYVGESEICIKFLLYFWLSPKTFWKLYYCIVEESQWE